MKNFIIASMVAIAMLVGIQPAFAEQFIAPEVSTSDSQCLVLDLPAGATAEAPECVAPWQVPEVTEILKVQGTATRLTSFPLDLTNYPNSQTKNYNGNYGATFSLGGYKSSIILCISDTTGAGINIESYSSTNCSGSPTDFTCVSSTAATTVCYRIDFYSSARSIHVYPTGSSSGTFLIYY